MLKRFATLLLTICFLITGSTASFAGAQTPSVNSSSEKPKDIAKMKKKAVKVGLNAKVHLHLRSGEVITGRISEITDDTVTLQYMSSDQVTSRSFDYSDIADLRGAEKLSHGSRAFLGVLGGLLVAGIVLGAAGFKGY